MAKDKAEIIGGHWNAFVVGLEKAAKEDSEKAITEADAKLKEEWGADYDKNLELTKRGYGEFIKVVPEFEAFLENTVADGITVGNHPVMVKVIHAIGSAMGEDWSPAGKPPGEEVKEGLIYDKSPAPPKNE